MKIDRKRLEQTIEELGRIGATERGGLTRLALSDEDKRGRDLMVRWMREAGLRVSVDQMGNIFGERPGEPGRPAVMMGSHVDSVPTGGKYDGQLGVLCALETIRTLDDHRVRTRHPVTLVIFTNEEGARFQPAMIASGVMAGKIPLEDAYNARDKDGLRLVDELERIGYLGPEPCVARPIRAYLELHIEQGPVLESMRKSTGVVLGTFGVERNMLRFIGQAAHSGSTPIPMRRDAFLAAAQAALAFREIAINHSRPGPGGGVVCTVGVVNVEPKIVTAVPGVCEISLDQRALDAGVLAAMVRDAREASERAARENNVTVEWRRLWRIEPRPFDAELVRLCEEAVREETGDAPRLPSGPLHDAAEMVPHMPVVMMFAHSANGLSHCKEEDTPGPHLEKTIRAFLRLVDKTVAHVANHP
jgi:allantoate deiminase